MEKSRTVKGYFPMLSYFFGIILLLNGIVLLRPLGIAYDVVVTIFTLSLLIMYGALLSSIIFMIWVSKKRGVKKDLKIGFPLSILLLVSMSVLFILASDRLDPDGWFGWMFLIMSLMWFIGALSYDLFKRKPTSKKKKDSEDLPIATIALVASVFTAMAFLARGDNLENYNTLTIIMAIIWVIGAVFFFIKGTSERRKVRKRKKELNIPEKARIVQVDDIKDSNRGKPLVSKKHYLIGSPDILIEENGTKVPVEIKTGRAPKKPYFSHIMQLSAYLVLVDTNFKQKTSYGYIEYVPKDGARKRHKVEWDMLTKALVLSKVSEIRDAERTGVAHRNHKREGKCRSCSRRTGCPERLA
jgi:CRISPR-associated exonuclease Cas4